MTRDHNEYRFPRSMQEAFGPYTSNRIEEEHTPMHKTDKIVLAASVLALIALVVIIKVWG